MLISISVNVKHESSADKRQNVSSANRGLGISRISCYSASANIYILVYN
jgi:hypothetical protein